MPWQGFEKSQRRSRQLSLDSGRAGLVAHSMTTTKTILKRIRFKQVGTAWNRHHAGCNLRAIHDDKMIFEAILIDVDRYCALRHVKVADDA